MLAHLSAYQVSEMEAYYCIEKVPVTPQEKEAENLKRLKARFSMMVPINDDSRDSRHGNAVEQHRVPAGDGRRGGDRQ